MSIKRGDVYYVCLGDCTGHEQRSGRPAVVVSNNDANRYSDVIEVVYLTTKRKTEIPTHVRIYATGIPSTVLCEQVYSVDKSRLSDYRGHCSPREMNLIDKALCISLGLTKKRNGYVLERDYKMYVYHNPKYFS